MTEDLLGLGKLTDNGVEVLKTVYPDLLQPATTQVGKALETVFELSNTILLPLKLLNVKARLSLENRMKKYEEKLNAHPAEEVRSVIPDVGLPVIDRLTQLTNEEIADMFINFLVSASLNTSVNQAHPRFISILDSISVDEARIVKYLHENNKDYIPFIDFELHVFESQANNSDEPELSIRLDQNTTNLENEITFIENKNIKLYLSNLESLGLLKRHFKENRKEASDLYELLQKESEAENEKIKRYAFTYANRRLQKSSFPCRSNTWILLTYQLRRNICCYL